MTVAERKQQKSEGRRRRTGRGLCVNCADWLRRRGRIEEYPLTEADVPIAVVVEEWAWLANPWRSDAHNIEALAPRLGMTNKALERALERARSKGLLPVAGGLSA